MTSKNDYSKKEQDELLDDFADLLFSMWAQELSEEDGTIRETTTICKNP